MPDKKMPNQTPDKISKAEQQKQQPKQPDIPKSKLDKLFTGVQVVSQLKALGAKMFSKPKVDNTESMQLQQQSLDRSIESDAKIAQKEQIIATLRTSSQLNIKSAVRQQSREMNDLEWAQEAQENTDKKGIKDKQAEEEQKFQKSNPEIAETKVKKETKQYLKDLNEKYSNAETSEEKDSLAAQITTVRKSEQLQLQKLAQYKLENQQAQFQKKQESKSEKLKEKTQASIDKIDDKAEKKQEQQRLDDSIKVKFQETMAGVKAESTQLKEEREEQKLEDQYQKEYEDKVYSRRDNIQSIRKERIKEEKSVEKFQSKLEQRKEKAAQKKYDDEAYSRLDNIKSIRKERIKEEKSILKEQKKGEKLTAKAEKGGIFDKLKRGIDKMKNQSKSNSEARESAERENNPNYKGDVIGIAAKNAGEKMKRAYNKIKDSLKVDHDKEPLIPAKIAELKAKKKTSKLEVGNITTKIDPNKTKSSFVKLKDSIKNITKKKSKVEVKQSDKMKELSSELMSKQIDLKEAQKLLKSIQKETTRAGKKDPESDEYAVLDHQLRDIYNLVKQIELEVNIAEADSFAQAAIEKAQHNPEQEMANESAENKAKASKALEELTFQKEEAIKELKDKKARMNKRKGTKEKEFIKINKQIQKTNDDFNEKIQIQKSILNSQE